MFRPDAETDDAGGDAPKEWNFPEQTHGERRLELSGLDQHPRNDPALHGDLQRLSHAGWKLAALLDAAQMVE
jgi:hypothetical protein